MELFTYMEDTIYQLCMTHPSDNPFRKYLEYLQELEELSVKEQQVFSGLAREFLTLLETTEMQKSYKMPILTAFYHDGAIRQAITDQEVLYYWKQFFSTGTNWKDLKNKITYEEYQKLTDKWHLNHAKRNPIHFLTISGKGFFVEKEGCVLGLREELQHIVGLKSMAEQMWDAIEYRMMEYYRKRYEGESK